MLHKCSFLYKYYMNVTFTCRTQDTLVMITSSLQTSVAVFALIILHVSALDTFKAAVYEHAVILPDDTKTPVSPDEALLLMNKNIDTLEKAIKQAAEQVFFYFC